MGKNNDQNRGKINDHLHRPIISIEFDQKEPFCRVAELGNTGIKSYWFRIRVKNNGKTVAKSCIGKLMEIKDKDNIILTTFDPSALRWVAFKEIEELAINERKYNGWLRKIGTLDINRGEYEYLDIVYSREKNDGMGWGDKGGNDTNLHICITDRTPRGIKAYLERIGTYSLKITIYVENADPYTREFRLEWSGEWDKVKRSMWPEK
ncbi:MAG: hypothetical protein L6265_02320 [Thermoplasmatales archaeon]|nr:hypothetical protein [Thermoplasmatales archaeon]